MRWLFLGRQSRALLCCISLKTGTQTTYPVLQVRRAHLGWQQYGVPQGYSTGHPTLNTTVPMRGTSARQAVCVANVVQMSRARVLCRAVETGSSRGLMLCFGSALGDLGQTKTRGRFLALPCMYRVLGTMAEVRWRLCGDASGRWCTCTCTGWAAGGSNVGILPHWELIILPRRRLLWTQNMP